ncbi:Haloacid dehalogenase-like hydrolase domain-containing protein 3 [Zancudomyces culisetae]|uniref:Haloacid dehalogenase-like hydrolase domain-containing protein 3 n=1 Tax=Zancudomyces culisetae TaxID=1213189 RepID=A0A1R1PRA2_ZANCU|nr:Haloacid dehalogenase-like hydrolase domain-containing protein 3 [Zancudomyces culisetae]|eukprot:OMH83471.1 Haloacid dehalogenase-like hydrolase domain-containing protein 3 [Zancudomyces culisetae]
MDAFEWWKRVIERTWFLGGVHPSSIEKFIDSASEELFEHFSGSSGFSLYEDTIPTLQELYTNKYKLGIITNSDNRTKQVVKSFGLDRYFSFIITSESMQLQKPDPKLYSAAVENKYIPQQVCHIGDDLFGDYLASSKAGFNSILLDRKRKASNFNDAENVVKITSLTELV